GVERNALVDGIRAADPDRALTGLLYVARRDAGAVRALFEEDRSRRTAWLVFGASAGLADFFQRHPEELDVLRATYSSVPDAETLRRRLLAAVGERDGFAESGDEQTWVRLRVAYRRALAQIAATDLNDPNPEMRIPDISAALADAAAAALDASLAVARTRAAEQFDRAQV